MQRDTYPTRQRLTTHDFLALSLALVAYSRTEAICLRIIGAGLRNFRFLEPQGAQGTQGLPQGIA